jgi:hypothetical protein
VNLLQRIAWLYFFITASVMLCAVQLAPEIITLPTTEFMPGAVRPSNRYCEVYCSMPQGVHLVVRNGVIYRTYLFLPTTPSLSIGQLITLWGKPERAYYTSYGVAFVYWRGRFARTVYASHFNPHSRLLFIAYGEPLHENAERWRGFWTGR